MLVELLLPNKTDALFYTDGTGSAPVRWAHAVLDIRAVDEPYMQDYVVGPLPLVEGATTVSPLNYPYNKGIGKTRNYNADEDGRARFMTAIGSKLSDITMGLWGKELHGHRNDTLAIWGIDPLWQEDERIIDWQQFWGIPTSDFDSATLLPMGL